MRFEELKLAMAAARRFCALSALLLVASGMILAEIGTIPAGGIVACGMFLIGPWISLELWGDLLAWQEKGVESWLIWLFLLPAASALALVCALVSLAALTDPSLGPPTAGALAAVLPLSGGLTMLSMWYAGR